jgi:homoserine kinase type II
MAVFTPVSEREAQVLLSQLGLGQLMSIDGIAAGIENSNFHVTSSSGEWVLTLFERLSAEQLPFYLGLMQHLAQHGIPVPEPRADAAGNIVHQVAGRPAALVNRLDGDHIEAPDEHHCRQLGSILARMHLAATDFEAVQPNLRGLAWWTQTAPQVLPFLDPAAAMLLSEEMDFQTGLAAGPALTTLPRAAVHADLFRDNVLFAGLPGRERLSACFDFYFAGVDLLVYDLAVVLNDWCIDDDSGRLDETRSQALLDAYQLLRPLSAGELRVLPAQMRAAALRFWLSRLADWYLPRNAELLANKDPAHFERVLRDRVDNPWHPISD